MADGILVRGVMGFACRYRIETLARADEKLLTKEYLHLQVMPRMHVVMVCSLV